MQIILNDMLKQDIDECAVKMNKRRLEVFLFKYLYRIKLITEEDFRKSCGKSLNGCKFPVEFTVKLNRAYTRTLRAFLTEKNDLSFLSPLKTDHPEYYDETEHYLKQFYYGMICQLLHARHTQQTGEYEK